MGGGPQDPGVIGQGHPRGIVLPHSISPENNPKETTTCKSARPLAQIFERVSQERRQGGERSRSRAGKLSLQRDTPSLDNHSQAPKTRQCEQTAGPCSNKTLLTKAGSWLDHRLQSPAGRQRLSAHRANDPHQAGGRSAGPPSSPKVSQL